MGWFNIKGACSNQIIKCIVYTRNKTVGINKLLEIEKDKNSVGIKTVCKAIKSYFVHPEIKFDDDEEWIVLDLSESKPRGYRWRKAYIDVSSIQLSEYYNYIAPYGDYYKWEEPKYFYVE